MVDRYYYRGTTPGWPGNPILQTERKTCVSSDPLVATRFAIECLQHGPGTVLLIPERAVMGSIDRPNHSAIFESEVVVNLTPIESFEIAEMQIDAQIARDILIELGFGGIPVRISGKSALREVLVQSYAYSQRLSPDQTCNFNQRALETLK